MYKRMLDHIRLSEQEKTNIKQMIREQTFEDAYLYIESIIGQRKASGISEDARAGLYAVQEDIRLLRKYDESLTTVEYKSINDEEEKSDSNLKKS